MRLSEIIAIEQGEVTKAFMELEGRLGDDGFDLLVGLLKRHERMIRYRVVAETLGLVDPVLPPS